MSESSHKKPMTTKQQKRLEKKLAKEAKIEANMHSKADRVAKVIECIKQLNELGLNQNYNKDTKKIHNILKDYANTGTSYRGQIEIEGTKRIFYYDLPWNKQNQIGTMLKYDKNI
jgi:hypothetical protein